MRRKSMARLNDINNKDILINGIGTGLDLEYLPDGARYTGSDITPLMLRRAEKRAQQSAIDIRLICADSQKLPFKKGSFDIIIMHLILAVVPDPERALQEADRVLKKNGSIYILDKFLRPGQLAPVRRGLNAVLRHIATRTDVVFEDVLSHTNPHVSPGGEMITKRFGFTKDFTKERNNHAYFRLSKMLCGFKDQVRARPSGEKCGLNTCI